MVRRRHGVLVAAVGVLAVAAIALIIGVATNGSSTSAGKRGPGDPEALEQLSAVQGAGRGAARRLGGLPRGVADVSRERDPAGNRRQGGDCLREDRGEGNANGTATRAQRATSGSSTVRPRSDPARRHGLLRRHELDREPRHPALVVSPRPATRSSAGCGSACPAAASGAPTTRTRRSALKPQTQPLDQNLVGTLTLDPTDKKGDTIYLGTGEANRCGSGCEAGVGIYKSTNGGDKWTKIAGACVSNATYACVMPGNDAFLGRGDQLDRDRPAEREPHPRRLGAGCPRPLPCDRERRRDEARAGRERPRRLYESTDGGQTFTEVGTGTNAASFGTTDLALDPLNPDVVYASAFDAGAWRRDAGAAATAFQQVFVLQFAPAGAGPGSGPCSPWR